MTEDDLRRLLFNEQFPDLARETLIPIIECSADVTCPMLTRALATQLMAALSRVAHLEALERGSSYLETLSGAQLEKL